MIQYLMPNADVNDSHKLTKKLSKFCFTNFV